MWFTLTGRLHTRLASLTGPLVLTVVVATTTGDSDYWLLFALMTSVGLVLETGVYGWLLGYQPRWLTIGLGVVEFLLLKWIVEWPYPFEIRLHTRQALSFYVVAWLLMWLTTQAMLPVLWPRWMEDGGEFRSARGVHAMHHTPRLGDASLRRTAYLSSLIALFVVVLPWLAAMARTSAGQRFVGLMWLEHGHFRVLADMYAGSLDTGVRSSGYLLGLLARLGRWPIVPVYHVAWVIVAFGWLLGITMLFTRDGRKLMILLAFGWLPVLLLPVSWLLCINVVVWSLILVFRWRPTLRGALHKFAISLAAASVLIWSLSWLRANTAPHVYVKEDVWQMLSWIGQSLPLDTVVLVPPDLSELVRSVAGRQVVTHASETTAYQVLTGPDCIVASTVFVHGDTCVVGP